MNWFGEERFITDAWERRIPTVRLWEDEGGDYYFKVGMWEHGFDREDGAQLEEVSLIQRATIHVDNGFNLRSGRGVELVPDMELQE